MLRRRYVWVESFGASVPVNNELHLVLATREVSHVESLMQGLAHERRVKQQLDELVDRQRRFMTTVSHRARTPLTALVGMVEVLRVHHDRLDDQRAPCCWRRSLRQTG